MENQKLYHKRRNRVWHGYFKDNSLILLTEKSMNSNCQRLCFSSNKKNIYKKIKLIDNKYFVISLKIIKGSFSLPKREAKDTKATFKLISRK